MQSRTSVVVSRLWLVVKGQDKASADVLLSDAVLSNAELQAAAVKALATLGNDKTPTELLRRFSNLPAGVKGDAVSTLVSRPTWTKILLTSIGNGDVPSGELHAYHVRQILTFNDASLNDLLKNTGARFVNHRPIEKSKPSL